MVRSTSARFFTDPSIGAAALKITTKRLKSDFETFGLFFESLVLRDIRIYAESIGGKVYRYKDKSNLEVDFIVELNDSRWGAFEVKMGSSQFDETASKLIEFSNNIDYNKMSKPSFLAIISATEYAYTRADGVHIIPLGILKN